jgi:LmbE family N-acetylglucosaminyl deacetylase
MLNYRDSGMKGTLDNGHPDSLYQADLDDVAHDLVRIMRDIRPHVVITHDRTGGYFHPDHIKVNHAVHHAWDKVGDAQAFRGLVSDGFATWQPLRLYHTVIPHSALKWLIRILRLTRQDPHRFGRNKDIDLTQVGVPDDQIHVRFDVRPYMDIKAQASACHKTQGGGGAASRFPAFLARRFLRYENFVQAQPPGAHTHKDLFEGLEINA